MNNNSTKKVMAQVIKDYVPRDYDYSVMTIQGEHFLDIKSYMNKPKQYIRKINKTEYIELSSGEIKEFNTMDKELQAKSKVVGLTRTFEQLRHLIRTNFTEKSESQLFITLTYSQRGRTKPDQKELYADFRNFMKRLKYEYDYHDLEYIVVFEPQGNGWFHSHIMLKTTNQAYLAIAKEKMTRIWGLGGTTTERLKSSDVGSYYTAYFTDLIDESKKKETKMSPDEKSKAREKGGRLKYYPKGFRLFRCSRGIERPKVAEGRYDEFKRATDKHSYKKIYDKAYEVIQSDEGTGEQKTLNKICKSTYKKKAEKERIRKET